MKRAKNYGSFFRKLSLYLLLLGLFLIVSRISFQTAVIRKDDFSSDPVTKLLGIAVITSLLFCVLGQLVDRKLKTVSFGFHFSLLICLSVFALNEFLTESGIIAIIEGEIKDSFKDKQGVNHKLPFKLQCEDVILSVYDGTYKVKSYITQLRVTEGSRPAFEASVSVNHPLWIARISGLSDRLRFGKQSAALYFRYCQK